LGTDLPEAAALNDLQPSSCASCWCRTRTAWVDTQGAVFYKDPASAQRIHCRSPKARTPTPRRSCCTASLGRSAPSSSTSTVGPSAERSGTRRTRDRDVAPSLDDRRRPQLLQRRRAGRDPVHLPDGAEDYAPFDVNVTTQDPGQRH
jgi:hypothetical protein